MYSFIPVVMGSGITSVPTGYGTILVKKSAIPNKVPTRLQLGELALNVNDSKLYVQNTNNVIKLLTQTIAQLESTGGRLTLSPTLPVSADISGASATTLYYLPYTGNYTLLYNTNINQYELVSLPASGLSLAGLAAGNTYDVFVINNLNMTSSLVLSAAWSGDNTRANTLYTTNGMYFRGSGSTDIVARFVGIVRMAATGQAEDSIANRYLWNQYNRVNRLLSAHTSGYNWYTNPNVTTIYRPCNASTTQVRFEFIVGEYTYILAILGSMCRINTAASAALTGISFTQSSGWVSNAANGYTNNINQIVGVNATAVAWCALGRYWCLGLDIMYGPNTNVSADYWPDAMTATLFM